MILKFVIICHLKLQWAESAIWSYNRLKVQFDPLNWPG